MPPKSKKTESKEKKKTIEDKTFGLKNKNKSAKVGKYVQQVEQQVMAATSRKARKAEDEKLATAARKLEDKKKQEEVAQLFKPVVQQKVPFGVNPKTVLCEFFKAGACTKGDKCKFSHDTAVGRKGTKMDVYTDKRDGGGGGGVDVNDTMDKWNEERLEQVVLSKHGNPQTTTSIVCKYFLEAIETRKYGWFWECPNGGDKCKYKHALPPGFVLKKDKKKKESEGDEISLEEFLETERHRLGSNQTPVTLESFTKWKTERTLRREADEVKAKAAKEKAFKAGKLGNMSGRDYFEFNPEMYDGLDDGGDGGDAFDFAVYRNADGGYQQDTDYAAKAMSEMCIEEEEEEEEQSGGGGGDAPVTNEALFAAEDLSEDGDDDDDDGDESR